MIPDDVERTLVAKEQEFVAAALSASRYTKEGSVSAKQVWYALGWPIDGNKLDAMVSSLRTKGLIYDVGPLKEDYLLKVTLVLPQYSTWLFHNDG